MSLPHNEQNLGKPLRNKKKRSAVFIVIVASIAVHVLAGLGLAAVKIIEVLQTEHEFEAPPIVEVKPPPPPPPPPPPTSKRAQRSMPRPQPLAVKNAQNTSVPAIEMNNANLTVGGGRGFGGGLGALGGAVADSLRITSFGYDRAMEGTLEGTLYDFKQDSQGKPIKSQSEAKVRRTLGAFVRNFNIREFERDFYKADKKLYASYFVIPFGDASIAPKSFGVEKEIKATMLAASYKGTYRPTETGRFRLLGRGDDVMVVRINGKIVLDGSLDSSSNWRQNASLAKSDQSRPRVLFDFYPRFYAKTGDWFDLREGVDTEVEVLISEVPGGKFGAYLLIEKEGVPGLKIFSTRPLSNQDKRFLRKRHSDSAQFIK
jgi:hypothetical protein